jgi:hypothetical protein
MVKLSTKHCACSSNDGSLLCSVVLFVLGLLELAMGRGALERPEAHFSSRA